VPYIVLLKAIDDAQTEPSEARKRVLKYVLETCVNIMEFSEPLRRQVIEQASNFLSPTGRTADQIPSIQILTAQLLCLQSLPEEKRQAEDPETKEKL
jgi:hypothetical protein